MRKIVLASHGKLAAGMKNSLEMIAGPQPQVSVICAYTDETPDLKGALAGLVEGLADDGELIVVTDILGGSVNNEASQFRDVPRVHVVTGMNLGFVLSLALGGEGTSTPELIDECIDSAKEQLMRIAPSEDGDDEDF